MNQFVQQYISNRYQPTVKNPFPIAIVITKYDLCQHREKQEVIEDIKKLFQALFTPDSGWLVMICPVSLGTELSNDLDNGSIVPVNVHLPIVFAVYSQIRVYGIKLQERRTQIYEALETLKKTSPLIKLFQNRELQAKANQLQDCEASIAIVEENMQLLARELQQVSLFLSGSEVSANV
jgi:hypothetical protein